MASAITFIAAVSILCYIRSYEKKDIVIEKTVLIALLSAISTAGRILFAAIPNVQPSSFIIIMAGICFGSEIGMMAGLITAIASNLLLGQGPWTIWQMLCWGTMGLLSGLLSEPLLRFKAFRVVYGLVWGFLFGWIMNLWYLSGAGEITLGYIISGAFLSFYFDLAHGLTNAILLLFTGDLLARRFCRIGIKYGIKTKPRFNMNRSGKNERDG